MVIIVSSYLIQIHRNVELLQRGSEGVENFF